MRVADAFAFDLFGTLVDFTSLQSRFAGVSAAPAAFVDAWRAKQLQYAFLSTMMERYQNFDRVTELALDYTCAQQNVVLDVDSRKGALDAWHHLPAYPDVVPVLQGLRERKCRLAVLSNGTPEAIARTLEGAGLTALVDGALSVDAVQEYKPRPAVYRLAANFFSRGPSDITFVSSNGWDALGAGEFGFTAYWCNRTGAPVETLGAKPARIIRSLQELLDR